MGNESQSQTFNVLYNKEDYFLQVNIFKENDDGDNQKNYIFDDAFLNDLIKKLIITSDIKFPVLIGELYFIDKGFSLFQKIKSDSNRLFLRIQIKKIVDLNSTNTPVFDNKFIITNIELLDKTSDAVTIKFEFAGIDWIKFTNNFRYSSVNSKTESKSYITIIKELFSQNDLPLLPIDKIIDKDGVFITPTNYTLYDSILYNLKRAINDKFGFYFIKFDPIQKKYSIESLKDILDSKAVITTDNTLNLPTKELVLEQQRTINNIKKTNYLDKEKNQDITKELSLKKYTYDIRKFTDEKYDFNTLLEVFPKPQNNTYKINLNPIGKNLETDIKNYKKEYLYRQFDLYTHLSNAFLYSNAIEFQTYGVLNRFAGQIINIIVDNNSQLNSSFDGNWFIQRIYHTFLNGEYINTIHACRLDERIDQTDSNQGT
jgi:hypothetical protein